MVEIIFNAASQSAYAGISLINQDVPPSLDFVVLNGKANPTILAGILGLRPYRLFTILNQGSQTITLNSDDGAAPPNARFQGNIDIPSHKKVTIFNTGSGLQILGAAVGSGGGGGSGVSPGVVGLVSWWPLNEAAATNNALDSHGTNTMPRSGSPDVVAGKVGGGRGCSPTGSKHFVIADNPSLSMGDFDCTFAGWVKIPDVSGFGALFGKWGSSTEMEYVVYYNSSEETIVFQVSLDSVTFGVVVSELKPLVNDQWYFVAAWHDSVADTLNIQIDNGVVSSSPWEFGLLNGTSTFCLGRANGFGYFANHIDEISVWKKMLAAEERTWLYNGGAGRSYLELNPAPPDADATAFLTAAGITDPIQSAAIDSAVKAMKTAGIWAKCSVVYPMVGGTYAAHKFNLKDPRDLDAAYRWTQVNSMVHDSGGATPDGVTSTGGYGDTHFPLTSLTDNNTHIGVYIRNNVQSNSAIVSWSGTGLAFALIPRTVSGDVVQSNQYDSITGRVQIASGGDSRGFLLATRRSPTDHALYRKGVLIGSTVTPGPGSLANWSGFGLTLWNSNNGAAYSALRSPHNMAWFTVGAGLTAAEQLDYHYIVQAFQTALGRQV